MKKYILIIFLLFSATLSVRSQQVNNFHSLDSVWNNFTENRNFSYYNRGWGYNLNHFLYYQQISKYLESIFSKDLNILRIINAQQYNVYFSPINVSTEYFFSPDVCFLYSSDRIKDIHIIYWDNIKEKVIDTVLYSAGFNFNQLLNKKSYIGMKWYGDVAKRNKLLNTIAWNWYGTGISISVYTSKRIFVKSIEEFWKCYDDGLQTEFFEEINGKKKTIKNIQNMLLAVRARFKFEDHCRVCGNIDIVTEKWEEYKLNRHKIIDVEAVDRRENDWRDRLEKDKK